MSLRQPSAAGLLGGVLLCALLLASAVALRPARAAAPQTRQLELHNLHTGEVLNVTFGDDGPTAPQSSAQLRHLLRDYRRNEEHDIDTGLFLQLSDLARAAGCAPVYEIISGYRSPATNSSLRAAGHAVAERSLHMEGRAIDVRLHQCPLARLHELALAAKRGGVGYYPRSNFVHLDTGRVRSWQE
jgi:uncharacterized protein YcbK (DUF882 family)